MKRVFQLLAFASLAVSPAFAGLPQAIAPVDIVVKAPDAPSFSLPATTSAGLPITWTALAGPASVAGVNVSMTGGIGAVTLRGRQAGDATYDPAADRFVTFVVETGGGFLSVSAGEAHVAGIKADGNIYAWGRNTSGQLGDGTISDRATPAAIVVTGTASWSSVACGSNHTVARRSDGTLWAWGSNASGQLGINSNTDAPFPTKIGTATNWSGVACGANHTVAWRADGSLYAWGLNSQGQLGDTTLANRTAPVRIGSALDWTEVSCGAQHTIGRRAGGSLWAWGNNTYGQLGDGSNTRRTAPFRIGLGTDWTGVGAGLFFSTGRRAGGTLWAWGNNDSGQLGDGTRTTQTNPQQVGTATGWTAVNCGAAFVIGRRSDGYLWAWGDNAAGQLGDGTTTDQLQPTQTLAGPWVSVAAGSACALGVRNQSLWSWGTNDNQQLALPPSVTGFSAVPSAARIPYPSPQAAVSLPSAVLPTATLTPAVTSALPPVLRIVSGPAVLSPDSRSVSFTAEGLARIEVAQAGDAAWEPAAAHIFDVQVDATGPVFLSVPASFTAQASSPSGAVVTYAAATATDAVSGPALVVGSPPSGSLFPVGSTPVTCTATDALGNTTTAQFTVFVNRPPAFSGYSISTPKNTSASLSLVKLLGQASDPDGGVPALAGFISASTHGGAVTQGTGGLTYTPPANFAGTDSFTVNIADGQGGLTPGTVTVSVAPGAVNVPEVSIQPGSLAHLVFRGIPNQTYVIQKSFNLTTWTDAISVPATSNGTVSWSDPTPVTGPVFWRLAVPQ